MKNELATKNYTDKVFFLSVRLRYKKKKLVSVTSVKKFQILEK